ncbi:DUF4304 domain-containing protein [Nocardioides gilvus]|uniref:DUF4304 domain-containing protein n=1 Tax=Nocardioides gilvus TaxID=1735589 RepID=UPI000D749447|nr:DUF4304 domain-containing protein [Nocardioides gilvus]
MTDLDAEREAVNRALLASGHDWDAWPAVAATADWSPRARLSALLLMLSAPEQRIQAWDGGHQLLHDSAAEVIERLRRRRLPWDPAAAGLALEVVAAREYDLSRVGVALRASEELCSEGAAGPDLLDRLHAFTEWLDALPHSYGVEESRRAARRALAAATPPDLLDLSLLSSGDRWAPFARDAARAAESEDVVALVRLLGELGNRRPSQRWSAKVAGAVAPAAARDMVRLWLELACEVEPVDGVLFVPGNDDVVRAAVLATRHLVDEPWVSPVLGVLARRGAAPSHPGSVSALALKVAGAAVDTLAARGGEQDRVVLAELFEELTRRDLLRRVGNALGDVEALAARDEHLRKEKEAAVRRKADPAPKRERAAVDALLRTHVAPTLRAAGFKGSGRTWRRLHADRVDLVHLGSSGENLSLSYGVWFDAAQDAAHDGAHDGDRVGPVDRARILEYQAHLRLHEQWSVTPEGLSRCAAHLGASVVPFLDAMGVHELLRDHLVTGSGAPRGAGVMAAPNSPAHRELLGRLARARGLGHE